MNFKRGMAHDMNTQLRYLLCEALKVNLSAAFFLSSVQRDIRLFLGKGSGIYAGVMANGKILEQHTNAHAIKIA